MKSQDRPFLSIFLISLLFLPASNAVSAEIYQWKDKDGNIVFSDSPPLAGVDVQIRKFKEDNAGGPPAKGELSKSRGQTSQERRYRDINVTMYMTPTCPYCRRAREYLQALGVSLTEYNVDINARKREEMLRKTGGSAGVPVIDVEGIVLRGYSPEGIKAAVEKRRNP